MSWVELSWVEWKGYVTYGPGADISLPHYLKPGVHYQIAMGSCWSLAHKSDPRAEIWGNIVRYDALALRPEVLLS